MRWQWLLALMLAGLARTEFAEAAPLVGVSAHLTRNPTEIVASVDLLKQLGAESIREDFPWNAVETVQGKLAIPQHWDLLVDQLLAHGVQPLVILCYGNPFYDNGGKPRSAQAIDAFVRYARFVAEHFRGRVTMYEVWNEWDGKTGNTLPGSATDYLRLLKPTYQALKQVDPKLLVLGGAMMSRSIELPGLLNLKPGFWLGEFVSGGGLLSSDGVSVHPYNFTAPNGSNGPAAWARTLDSVENWLKSKAGREVPLYVTEMGWPTHKGPGSVNAEQAAAYATQLLLLTRKQPYVKGIWWYDLRDDGTELGNREHHFGLLDPLLQPKSAFFAYQVAQRALGPSRCAAPVGVVLPNFVQMLECRESETKPATWALWSDAPRSFQLTFDAAPTLMRTGAGAPQTLTCAKAENGTCSVVISLDLAPAFVTGATLRAVSQR